MKIGHLTLPLTLNYGGILQAYALQQILKRKGHSVSLIHRSGKDKSSTYNYLITILKRTILKYVFRRKLIVFLEYKRKKRYYQLCQNIAPFVDNNFLKTEAIHSSKEFDKLLSYNFDAFIVGSDQVWRPDYTPKVENYFFDFLHDDFAGKRVSYAASFGVSDWLYSEEETSTCERLLAKFDAVSVRESSGVDMCKNYFNIEAKHVLDPTMLLEKEDYLRIIDSTKDKHLNVQLLVYVLDTSPKIREIISNISSSKNLVAYSFPMDSLKDNSLDTQKSLPSVENWLHSFHTAKLVITDSFHGTVFSIIFNKPFIVLSNSERGLSRISSLLNTFHLNDRLLTKDNTQDFDLLTNTDINWNLVNEILVKKRTECIEYLTNSL